MPGYVYKICVGDSLYVGSTFNLKKRYSHHLDDVKHNRHKVHRKLRETGTDLNMIIIETNKSISKRELVHREQYWKDKLKADLNEHNPVCDQEKMRQKNLERQNERITCECGASVTRAHISRHRQSEKHKSWAISNSRPLAPKPKKKISIHTIHCPCGGRYVPKAKYKHEATKKHKNWLKTQTSNNTNNADSNHKE